METKPVLQDPIESILRWAPRPLFVAALIVLFLAGCECPRVVRKGDCSGVSINDPCPSGILCVVHLDNGEIGRMCEPIEPGLKYRRRGICR